MNKQTSDSHSMTKLKVVTTLAVVTLHIGTALALVKMDVPKHIKPPEEPEPIEIELVTAIEASSQHVIENEPKSESDNSPEPQAVLPEPQKSEPKSETKSASKPKSKPEPKPNKTEPKKSKPRPNKTKTEQDKPKTDEQSKQDEIEKNRKVIASEELNKRLKWEAEQQRLRQEQADREAREAKERAEQEARQKAAREKAAAEKAAKEKAEREARETKERAEQAAKEEAARRAKEEAERKAALEAEAASTKPQNFSPSQASLQSPIKLQVPTQVRRNSSPGDVYTVYIRLEIDKQGNVIRRDIVTSSGNNLIDKAAYRSAGEAKFHPFKNDKGQAVVGIVTMPFEYKIN